MPKIKFLPYNVEVENQSGETVIETAMRSGIHINASCGGMGVCNKCKVIVEEGKVKGEIIEGNFYKACTLIPLTDVVIRIPVESEVDRKALFRKPKKFASAFLRKREEGPPDPVYQTSLLSLEKPTIEDNTSDWLRLKRALFQKGFKNLNIGLDTLRKLPHELRNGDFKVNVSIYEDPRTGYKFVGDVKAGVNSEVALGVAIDLGTTTLQLELVDLASGKTLAQTSDYNPQISYGEDVISRIEFAKKEGRLKILGEKVRERLYKLMLELVKVAGRSIEDVGIVSVAGNTVMSHLFLEVEPRFLREYPYVPATVEFPLVPAEKLGWKLRDGAVVILSPCVASYVGGDITAGVMASLLAEEPELTLFIDLGTNGEIVIGNKEFMMCAACSAGPAFEGGGIKHGMRATIGAIEAVSINPSTYEPMILTIGRRKPKGLCGSGIISLLANLFITGLIDKAGKFRRDLKHPRIREGENGWEYVLVWKENSATGQDIVFTEADIENLIRAKGAMFAGYQILLESVGLSLNDLGRVFLAGTFGSFIDLEEAITIGLLPDLPREKFYFLGNTSLQGAKKALLYKENFLKVHEIAKMMTHVELSNHPRYMDYYTAALFLPHTNEDLFPSVKSLHRS